MRNFGPEHQTVGRRKELRQKIRNTLGTSSDGAPRLGALFNVARLLDHLVRQTTGNRFSIAIVNSRTGQPATAEEQVEALDAWQDW